MMLLFNAMDKNKRERNTKFFRHALPCVRATQKDVHVNLPHAPSLRVKVDITEGETERLIFMKTRYGVVW